MTNQQLAESIVKDIAECCKDIGFHFPYNLFTKSTFESAILPLIAEFKKEVAADAWGAADLYSNYKPPSLSWGKHETPPDRKTYIDNLNK